MKVHNCLLLVSVFLVSVAYAKELKVTVYYESLCPYSRQYLVNQAIPGYQTLKDNINLDLVPYGNAKTTNNSGSLTFDCQHGPDECKGNRIHGCVLELNSVETAAAFISCDLGATSPADDATLENCAKKTGVSYPDVQKCVDSGKGDEILAANGERTHSASPAIRGVPTTFFDDVYDSNLNDDAYTSFLKVACYLLDNEPQAC